MLWITDWLMAKTEKEKRVIWEKSHPNKPVYFYTFCPEIKQFWRSPMGRFIHDSYSFWAWIKQQTSPKTLYFIRWYFSWQWRSLRRWIRTNYSQSDIRLKDNDN